MTQRTQQTPQTERIVWVHLQKDYAFILRDEAVEGRLTKRAIASIQRRVGKASLVAETSDLSRASASFKVLTLPNSRSFFLRKEKHRNYEVPAQQLTLLGV